MSAQLSFDLDEMIAEVNPAPPRPPYKGRAPLGFTVEYFTLAEFQEAQDEARLVAEPQYTYAWRHMWHPSFSSVGLLDVGDHSLSVVEADVRCNCRWLPPYGIDRDDCSCVAASLYRTTCEKCEWHAIGDENTVIAQWHDHAWPGWRDLPVMPKTIRPRAGGVSRKEKVAYQWAIDNHPVEFQRPYAPIITERDGAGTRHVPGYSPWGGYDISDKAVVTEVAA